MTESLDILIKNGNIIDGAGNPWLKKDIGIAEGKIKKIGSISGQSRKTIDADRDDCLTGFY